MTSQTTVDLTPSWTMAARIFVLCLRNGSSEKAKDEAEAEVMKMAALLEQHQRQIKAIHSKVTEGANNADR